MVFFRVALLPVAMMQHSFSFTPTFVSTSNKAVLCSKSLTTTINNSIIRQRTLPSRQEEQKPMSCCYMRHENNMNPNGTTAQQYQQMLGLDKQQRPRSVFLYDGGCGV
mmetsp:Transcript_10317/g.14570  ORF Transcript_10317/g.14570 Transcript_10317/m.14570 type:complete len:108 (+) Transcript_10317:2-325(+)